MDRGAIIVWTYICGILFFLLVVPIAILIFVRRKRDPIADQATEQAVPNALTDGVSHSHQTADIPPLPDPAKPSLMGGLLVLSSLLFFIACCCPLHKSDFGGGFYALTIGVIFIQMWIPNPLYLIGLALAAKRRTGAALVFASLASLWASAVVFGGIYHREVDIDGPAPVFWLSSMIVLLLAVVVGSSQAEN